MNAMQSLILLTPPTVVFGVVLLGLASEAKSETGQLVGGIMNVAHWLGVFLGICGFFFGVGFYLYFGTLFLGVLLCLFCLLVMFIDSLPQFIKRLAPKLFWGTVIALIAFYIHCVWASSPCALCYLL
jgi:hypothetical protein